MSRSRLLPLILLAPLCACAASRDQVALHTPDSLELFDRLIAEERELKDQLPQLELAVEQAVISPSPKDDTPAAEALAVANRRLQEVEAQLEPIERRVNQGQARPVADAAGGIHPALSALVMALVPLAGQRGRKLYWSALRSAARGQLLTSAGEILKAMGARHSSPQPPVQPS